MSIFNELKRRNIFRVGVAYAVAAWLLLQIVDLVLENINSPDWVMQVFMLALAVGFPIAIIIAWAFEVTPEGIKLQKHVDRNQSITHHTGRQLNRGIIVILSVAVVFLLTERFREDVTRDVTRETQPVEDAATAPGQTESNEVSKSIAVLPFVNMSSDPEQEYFSDGISEEILNSLAKVRELKVAGRTSSFAFKGQNQDLRLIGDTLGVNHILEGSVRKSGNKVRVTAQLIQVSDGFHLWSDTYDRELDDIFVIQDEIANAILKQMKAALLDQQPIASTKTDPFVYDLYLLARQKIRDRTQTSLENAAALLDQAIKADEGFAEAYAQRAIANLLLSDEAYGTIPNETSREEARAWIDRALELDPELAEAWAARGLYWEHARLGQDNAKAVEPLRRALEINPSLVDASNWLQNNLAYQGKLRASVDILEQMMELDPLYRPGINNAAFRFSLMGDIQKAHAILERARPFFPNEAFIAGIEATILGLEGRHGDALPLARQEWQALPNDSGARFGYALRLMNLGQFEEILTLNGDELRVAALRQLGRKEEATILAYRLAASGEDTGSLIHLLGRGQRHKELVEFVESRWPDLDALEGDFPSLSGFGNMRMALIAHAYRTIGNTDKFADAMRRLEISLTQQRTEGVDNFVLLESEAYFHMLAGAQDAALASLGEAIDRGLVTSPRMADDLPVFKPLEGDPRYEDIRQRMLAHLNNERARAGLEALTLDRAL